MPSVSPESRLCSTTNSKPDLARRFGARVGLRWRPAPRRRARGTAACPHCTPASTPPRHPPAQNARRGWPVVGGEEHDDALPASGQDPRHLRRQHPRQRPWHPALLRPARHPHVYAPIPLAFHRLPVEENLGLLYMKMVRRGPPMRTAARAPATRTTMERAGRRRRTPPARATALMRSNSRSSTPRPTTTQRRPRCT